MRNFVYLGNFEGSLSQDQNSLLFIYLFSKETLPGSLAVAPEQWDFPSPLPVPCAVWGAKKQGKVFVLLVPLLWVTFVVWSVGFGLRVQGGGARRGFVSRVCLSLRD